MVLAILHGTPMKRAAREQRVLSTVKDRRRVHGALFATGLSAATGNA